MASIAFAYPAGANSLQVLWDLTIGVTCAPCERSDARRRPNRQNGECVWCTGLMANRFQLARSAGLPESATEEDILVALYREHGAGTAAKITGAFAWALWDSRREVLQAARDRMGTQGLYYAFAGDRALIASRVEIILDNLPWRPKLNPRAVVAHINGLAPPAGETFYEGVRALEPGKVLSITRAGPTIYPYWSVEPQPTLTLGSDGDYAEALREVLFAVVRQYAPAGRAGVTLSGGMDSTSVAASLRAVSPSTEVTAFSWTAPELPEADEARHAAAVCSRLGLDMVGIAADQHWPLSSSRGVETSRATPFVGFYHDLWEETFRIARHRDTVVVFSGASGDHLFGGNVYAYPDLLLRGRWIELLRQLRRHLSQSEMGLVRVLRDMVLRPIASAYLRPWWPRRGRPVPWLGDSYLDASREVLSPSNETRSMLPGRHQRLEALRDPQLPQVIESLNLQALEHGLELRHPLMDHRLVDFACSLPTTQTFRAAQRKVVLRNAMKGRLPNEVLSMRGKIYPSAIFHRGLRERETAKAWELLDRMRCAELGFVKEAEVRRTYQDYLEEKHNSGRFWFTLTLEDWLRRHF